MRDYTTFDRVSDDLRHLLIILTMGLPPKKKKKKREERKEKRVRQNYNLSLCDLTLSPSQFILKTSLLIIVLYYQTKTPIGFLCRR